MRIIQLLFPRTALIFLGISLLAFMQVQATEVIKFTPSKGDRTLEIRTAIESTVSKNIKLVFEKGVYNFKPDYAFAKHCNITNHGNGYKKIIFPMMGYQSLEIDGNGSEFIFHGQVFPFLIENCSNVKIKNLIVDWDIPYLFQGEVIAYDAKEGWRDIKPHTVGFNWELKNGRIEFPEIDGFSYTELGSTLAFEKDNKRVVYDGKDFRSNPTKVEKRPDGVLRIYEKMKNFPPVGSILNSKGDREHDRYAPAFDAISSKNIVFDNVVVHHALGMGFLAERSENITIKNSGVYLRQGTDRVVSSTADATHFANCKGDILVENCRFENMLDDGTNVHGTYTVVDSILNEKTLRFEFKHFEQLGFEFAGIGDVLWFIHQPNVDKASENTVKSVKIVNDRFVQLTFENKLPINLKKGDLIENKTWNPSFTMRGCTIQNHRARNVVLKTPLKTVIEKNNFSSMMSSILFRGESFFWFESGQVEDVLIRNNHFTYCAYNGMGHAVLNITPRLGENFDQSQFYDRNIRFENNLIETFDNRIVWADRVDGLLIKGNKIVQTFDFKPLQPNAPMFEFLNCKDVKIVNNEYNGTNNNTLISDEKSMSTLKVKNNKGVKFTK